MTEPLSMPTPKSFVGKARVPVTAVFYDGNYQDGQLVEIKNWLESIAPPGVQIFDGLQMGMPYYLAIYDPATNQSQQIEANTYVFQQANGSLKVLNSTIFEILFEEETP